MVTYANNINNNCALSLLLQKCTKVFFTKMKGELLHSYSVIQNTSWYEKETKNIKDTMIEITELIANKYNVIDLRCAME